MSKNITNILTNNKTKSKSGYIITRNISKGSKLIIMNAYRGRDNDRPVFEALCAHHKALLMSLGINPLFKPMGQVAA